MPPTLRLHSLWSFLSARATRNRIVVIYRRNKYNCLTCASKLILFDGLLCPSLPAISRICWWTLSCTVSSAAQSPFNRVLDSSSITSRCDFIMTSISAWSQLFVLAAQEGSNDEVFGIYIHSGLAGPQHARLLGQGSQSELALFMQALFTLALLAVKKGSRI